MKRIIFMTLITILLFTGISCGKNEEKKEEITNGTMTCSRYEEAGGENAKSTIVATFENNKIIKAYSTLEFTDEQAKENVCQGLKTANQYSEEKIDYECNNNTVKFLNYFQLQEKKEYTKDEFYLEFTSTGFACEVKTSD